MSLTTAAVGRLLHLPPRRDRGIRVDADLPVPMRDGTVLLADRLDPNLPDAPVVLIRTPYGRAGLGGLIGRLVAERGYQVVVQSCRGTHGSAGEFVPFRNEEADGIDTLDWLERQPWFTGRAATFGASYLGITQWALAGSPREWLKAMVIAVSAADVRGSVIYPNGAFALETALGWAVAQDSPPEKLAATLWRLVRLGRALPRAAGVLPLLEGDAAILGQGKHVGFYRDWLEHTDPADPWWAAVDHRAKRGVSPAAVHLTAGWYDIFLPAQLDDFKTLRAAGRPVTITIGPWAHGGGLEGASQQLKGALEWFDRHLRGADPGPAPAVRACLMGSRRWVDLDAWPPAGDDVCWYLQPGRGLAESGPPDSEPDSYTHDPADPAPSAGGAALAPGTSGPRDQRAREARADVLCYTSEALTDRVTVLGPVAAELHVRSDAASADYVLTLCDVDPQGRSINVSTGIARIEGEALRAGTCVPVEMWPTGYEFLPGHRIRVQVASAAHPLYARNLGLGEPLATATRMERSAHRVFHDPSHPSLLRLRRFAG